MALASVLFGFLEMPSQQDISADNMVIYLCQNDM